MTIWERRLRLYSGLVLTVYVLQHLINHSLGIVSFETMESWRQWWSPIWEFAAVKWLLYLSLLTHFALALFRLYQRRTLNIPRWELMQLLFGLAIAPLVAGHIIGTRFAAQMGGMDPDYYYVVTAMMLKPRYLVQMPALILVLWVHVIVGLHFWLRLYHWYRQTFPVWLVLSVVLPSLSLAGFLRAALTAGEWVDDRDALADIFFEWNEIPEATREVIMALEGRFLLGMLICLAVTLAAREVRRLIERRTSEFRVAHSSGKIVMGKQGQTLLEALRMAGLRHASVCGGRGRCTTCRVRVGAGRDSLEQPADIERQALNRIGADPSIRLACQLRPSQDLAITPMVNVHDDAANALSTRGGVQGEEREVVCMFVDMRGSTRMGERILPYDVVFILNQFFSELSGALERTNGHYSQFAGDGLMALYGIAGSTERQAARDALAGAVMMFERLDGLNQRLKSEFGQAVQMGIGIHAGVAVVGHMGPPATPVLTAIGDNINIAARLESMTKPENCDIVISEQVLNQAGIEVDAALIKVLNVRGRVDGIRVGAWPVTQLRTLLSR